MSTAELKSNLHQLIDKIQDSKKLSIIYKFISNTFKTKEENILNDSILTHFSSESSLARDWNKPVEDKAWENL